MHYIIKVKTMYWRSDKVNSKTFLTFHSDKQAVAIFFCNPCWLLTNNSSLTRGDGLIREKSTPK